MPIVEPKNVPTPPPARKPRATTTPRPTPAAQSREDIRKRREEGANEFWGMCSAISMGFGWWADAATYQMHGPGITTKVVKYADNNEKIAAALDKFAEMAPIGELLTATMMMVVQLSTNHGLISPERGAVFGASHPNALATEMKARVERDLMEQQMRATREAQETALMRKEMEAHLSEMQET